MSTARIDLRGLEIIISFRGASAERLGNLRTVLRHLDRTYRDYTVWLVEADRAPVFAWTELADPKVRHIFLCDTQRFSRGATSNVGVRAARGPVLCLHDADVVANPQVFKLCVDDLLDEQRSDAWAPYQQVVNVDGALRQRLAESADFACLQPYAGVQDPLAPDMDMLYASAAGGITLMRRETFLRVGGFDPSFQGWGGEDDELLGRAVRLGVRWWSVAGTRLFHLHHDSASRQHWAEGPLGAANHQAAVQRRTLDEAAFAAHVEALRARL